jgi:hypothetical protein
MGSDEPKSATWGDNLGETIDPDHSAFDIQRDEGWDNRRVCAVFTDLEEAVWNSATKLDRKTIFE